MKQPIDTADPAGSDLDPEIRRFVQTISKAAAEYPDFHAVPYTESRQWAEQVRAPWSSGGPAMLETEDLHAPTREGPVKLRIHKPASGPLPTLIYLHGGGWTLFSLDTHDRLMREYAARTGFAVVGVDYPLSPETKYPRAIDQIVAVVDWLREQGPHHDLDTGRLAVGGDSAGANLSLATSLRLRDAGQQTVIRALLLNYGAYTTECSAEACRRYGGPRYMLTCDEMTRFWRNYMRDEDDARDPLVCPLLARLDALPPAFLAIAECDILAEQNHLMVDKLRRAGVEVREAVYSGASHSFLEAVAIAALSDRAVEEASSWLRETV